MLRITKEAPHCDWQEDMAKMRSRKCCLPRMPKTKWTLHLAKPVLEWTHHGLENLLEEKRLELEQNKEKWKSPQVVNLESFFVIKKLIFVHETAFIKKIYVLLHTKAQIAGHVLPLYFWNITKDSKNKICRIRKTFNLDDHYSCYPSSRNSDREMTAAVRPLFVVRFTKARRIATTTTT